MGGIVLGRPTKIVFFCFSKPHLAQLGGEQLIYMPGGHQLAAHGHGGLSLHHHYLQQQTQLAVQAAQQQSLRQVQQQVSASRTYIRTALDVNQAYLFRGSMLEMI